MSLRPTPNTIGPGETSVLIYGERFLEPVRHLICRKGSAMHYLYQAANGLDIARRRTRIINEARGLFCGKATAELLAERRRSVERARESALRAVLAIKLGFLA